MIEIDNIIEKLIKQNETNNPIKIAKNLGIHILYEELGSLNGYYNTVYRHKLIHINSNLTEQQQLFTVAHELGHALLHPNTNTAFLKTHTHLVVNKFENEANLFAINLLITDEDIKDCKYLNYVSIANTYGCSAELVSLRFKWQHCKTACKILKLQE